ncbi:MAG: TraB/GumN family protein [Candidatus Aenigmarchaeota archaeon]|nr:TraB/GumN family protein [Candidatus Aenigmarchaeota archaeon]
MTIYIVGTSHIAKESLKKVKKAIDEKNPDCVCVELDSTRYFALKNKNKKQVYVKIPLMQRLIFSLMKKMQDKLSRETNIFAGQEMLNAVKLAEKKEIPHYFIDQDISVTINHLMAKMSFLSKLKFLFYLGFGFVGISIPGMKGSKELDLNKVPEADFIEFAMGELKNQFPAIYSVLVLERNVYMAHKIKELGEKYDNVVVVVGAGHVMGIGKILEKDV